MNKILSHIFGRVKNLIEIVLFVSDFENIDPEMLSLFEYQSYANNVTISLKYCEKFFQIYTRSICSIMKYIKLSQEMCELRILE